MKKTINDIASLYGIHPSMVNKWKNLALERLPEVMQDKHSKKQQDRDFDEARLH